MRKPASASLTTRIPPSGSAIAPGAAPGAVAHVSIIQTQNSAAAGDFTIPAASAIAAAALRRLAAALGR